MQALQKLKRTCRSPDSAASPPTVLHWPSSTPVPPAWREGAQGRGSAATAAAGTPPAAPAGQTGAAAAAPDLWRAARPRAANLGLSERVLEVNGPLPTPRQSTAAGHPRLNEKMGLQAPGCTRAEQQPGCHVAMAPVGGTAPLGNISPHIPQAAPSRRSCCSQDCIEMRHKCSQAVQMGSRNLGLEAKHGVAQEHQGRGRPSSKMKVGQTGMLPLAGHAVLL